MWEFLANLIGSPVVNVLIKAYQAKLAAGNTSKRIAADLGARELAVQQNIADEGRWWTAAPRAIACWSFAISIAKCVVRDKVLGLGSTLTSALDTWVGWFIALWFGGRRAEKVARIMARRCLQGRGVMAEEKTASAKLVDSVALTLFARVAMIVATRLISPIALWRGSRGVATIDEILKNIDVMKEASIEQSVEMPARQRISPTTRRACASSKRRAALLSRSRDRKSLI